MSRTSQRLTVVPPDPEPSPPPEDDPIYNLRDLLDTDKKGRVRETLPNLEILLNELPGLGKDLWYNQFSATVMLGDRPYIDEDVTLIQLLIATHFQIEYSPSKVASMVNYVARKNQRNPLTTWLDSLQPAPGTSPDLLDTWLSRAVYGPDATDEQSSKIKNYGRAWAIQAVARAYRPGVEAHALLILQGGQGKGKSTFFKILGGEWFCDTKLLMGLRQVYQQIAQAWIYEVAELDSFNKSEAEEVKAFLTSPQDTFTPPYGRYPVTLKRHVVFGASTNKHHFLKDDTGSRRFLTVPIGDMDLAWLRAHRESIFAYARDAFRQGEPWHLSAAEQAVQETENEKFRISDPWEDLLVRYVNSPTNIDSPRFLSSQLLVQALELKPGQMPPGTTQRLASCMRSIGFHPYREPGRSGARGWARTSGNQTSPEGSENPPWPVDANGVPV